MYFRRRGLHHHFFVIPLWFGHHEVFVQMVVFDDSFQVHAEEKMTQVFFFKHVVIEQLQGVLQFFF